MKLNESSSALVKKALDIARHLSTKINFAAKLFLTNFKNYSCSKDLVSQYSVRSLFLV